MIFFSRLLVLIETITLIKGIAFTLRDTYDGPLQCYNETMIGGPLDNPTMTVDGCYSCAVGLAFVVVVVVVFLFSIFSVAY